LPLKGQSVEVNYTGRLTDGKVFDTSEGKGKQPFKVEIGVGQVIKAWDIGVMTMRLGEKAELTCPPEYAYGSAGAPPDIPADATLLFTMELLMCDDRRAGEALDEDLITSAE
jgi:FKBP-type peptidyl-prolyl cis-trans isomerase